MNTNYVKVKPNRHAMKKLNLQPVRNLILAGCFLLFISAGAFGQESGATKITVYPAENFTEAPVELPDATRIQALSAIDSVQVVRKMPAWINSQQYTLPESFESNDLDLVRSQLSNKQVSSGSNIQEERPWSTEIKSSFEKAGEKSTGYFWLDELDDRSIGDLSSELFIFYPSDLDLPSNATITEVTYLVRIDDTGSEFFPHDYEIYIGSETEEICVYNNLGVPGYGTDMDQDDDTENDTDIYLNRDTQTFDGEDAVQYYSCRIVDNVALGVGVIDYVRLKISWEAPSPNLDATFKPSGWSHPLVVNHNTNTETTVLPLYANKKAYMDVNFACRDYQVPASSNIKFSITVDGSAIATYNYSGANASYYYPHNDVEHTFTEGTHTICQTVDPDNDIWWESDETDNVFCQTVTVVGPPAAPVLSSPSNQSTCQPIPLTISWNSSTNAQSYDLQYDENSDFSSPTTEYCGGATSISVSELNPGTKYYWRVRAGNFSGNSSYSSSRSFTTSPAAPTAPSQSAPSNGAGCQPVSITLDWNSVTGASGYNVQVDNNDDFGSLLINQDGLTSTEYTASGLSAGTTYYWRVAAENSCGVASSWSSTRNFTTSWTPETPSLSTPSNGATCQSASLTLSWNSVSGATAYDVEADNNDDFSSPVTSQTDLSGTSASVSGLSSGTTYYWIVRAKNSCGVYSSWSGSRSFSTTGSAPAAPSPTSPSNWATCQPLSITLGWGSVSGAGTYALQVDNNSDFSSPIFNQADIASTSQAVSGLSEGTTYYWRIKASNSCDVEGSWSAIAGFTTLISSIGTPSLTGPDDNAECQPVSPTLSWESVANATGYALQVDNNPDFSSPEYSQSCSGNSHNCSDLSESTLYYWRVKASGSCDVSGSWSGSRSFETGSGGMSVPSLTGPADNSIEQPLALTLSWETVSEAVDYQFQLDDNDDFSSPLCDEELSATSKDISGLTGGTIYFWQVRANGECSASDWSEVRQFETAEGPDALSNAVNAGYNLEQNYPNPFMETTMIEFSIPVDGHVSIELLDLQGKTVGSYSGYYSAGNHSVEIRSGTAMQAGVYLYRMRTQGFIDTRLCVVR
jgi:hypothetical protein